VQEADDTTDLLRPNQIADAREELSRLNEMLNAPPHIRSRISDPGELRKRTRNLTAELEKYSPRPYSASEKDAALREFVEVSAQIQDGMPSSEEMRRNPPGAVGKQIAWQARTKKAVQRFKHIALRLMAGGDVPDSLRNTGDVANIERLRPLKTVNQLAMDGAQIAKKSDIHIGDDPAGTVLFSEAEMALLGEIAPAVVGALGVMDNATRAGIKDMLARAMPADASSSGASEEAKAEKPTMQSLGYSGMKKLAAQNGKNCKNITKPELISWLRANHLIQ
jgi:hypothetical protein